MALLHVNFYSRALGLCTSMEVILPQRDQGIGLEAKEREGGTYPVLWLLHGASDDHTIWMRRTSIERYVAPLGIAVVMPAVGLSRYTNMVYGLDYYDYVAEELPQVCQDFFPNISMRREDNYIAGLSMGGTGAMRIGLKNSERYSRICMLSSGSVIPLESLVFNENYQDSNIKMSMRRDRNINVYGVGDTDKLAGTDHDILKLSSQLLESGKPLPKIYHACGTEDPRYPVAQAMRCHFESMQGNPYQYEYYEGPGIHDWTFWDTWIQHFLAKLS